MFQTKGYLRQSPLISTLINSNCNLVFCFEHFNFQSLSESVTSIVGGCVCTPGYDEVVVGTYTGWVLGMTTEQQTKQFAMPGGSVKDPLIEDLDEKIGQLRFE